MMAVACQGTDPIEDLTLAGTDTDTVAEADTETAGPENAETETAEPETEPPRIEHDMHDWFILDEEEESKKFTHLSRMEGEVYDMDYDHNLVVIRDRDLDSYNNVITKMTVYNMMTGKVLASAEATSPLYAPTEDAVTLDVEIQYPVIRVLKTYYNADEKLVYDADYYLAKAGEENHIFGVEAVDAELIPTTFNLEMLHNGLVSATLGNRVVWIDKNLNVVRTESAVAVGYVDYFGEYQGFLYQLDMDTVRVFNREGLCSAEYVCTDSDAWLNAHILDNGNVLIQEWTMVGEYTVCDFVWDGDRYTVKSFVLDFDNGELTEVDLDFMVLDLATAYAQVRGGYDNFPFDLAEGKENQAYIHRFANSSINTYPEYVVMNNDLQVEYSVKNDTVGVDLSTANVIDYAHYSAIVYDGLYDNRYVFDLDGNVVSMNVNAYITGNYRVLDSGYIYDAEGNLIFDAKSEGYTIQNRFGDVIYLSKNNYVTGGIEYYLLTNVRGKKPVMLADGVNVEMELFADDYYILYSVENEEYTVCTIDGTELLVTTGLPYVSVADDALLISVDFDDESLLYIVTEIARDVNDYESEIETETTADTAADEN